MRQVVHDQGSSPAPPQVRVPERPALPVSRVQQDVQTLLPRQEPREGHPRDEPGHRPFLPLDLAGEV